MVFRVRQRELQSSQVYVFPPRWRRAVLTLCSWLSWQPKGDGSQKNRVNRVLLFCPVLDAHLFYRSLLRSDVLIELHRMLVSCCLRVCPTTAAKPPSTKTD